MAGPLTSVIQTDFSGGENLVTSPYILGPKQSQQCNNLIFDEHGSMRTRDGTLIQGASANQTYPIVKIYDFVNVAGTVYNLAIVYHSASVNTLFNRGTSPWTSIATFDTAYTIPDAVTFTNLVLFAGGYETIKSYDGAAFAAVANSPPGANHLSVHLSVLWAWNTAAATTATDGPSSLRGSAVNNTASWNSADQTFISKDDGQTGQGMGQFTIAESGISPTSTLICFKDRSAYEVSGVFGSSNFAVQKIKSDMGCVAPRTIQFVSGFGLLRLTHKGVALFNGVNDELVSEEIRPRLFGRDSFTAIRWASVSQSMAAQVQNPPLYLLACPVNDASLTRVFVYDLIRRSWSTCTFANAISTLELISDPGTLPVVLGGDYSAGQVRRYFYGDPTDDGTAISWSWQSKPAFLKSPMDRSYYRRMILKMFKVTSGSSVSAAFTYGPMAPITTKTITLPSTVAPFSGYGVDAYGSLGYGSEPTANNSTDVDINFDIGAIANNVSVTVSGTGAMRIRGIEWHLRPKSLTRSTIAA